MKVCHNVWQLNSEHGTENIYYFKNRYNCFLTPLTNVLFLFIHRCIRSSHCSKRCFNVSLVTLISVVFAFSLHADWKYVPFTALITFRNRRKICTSSIFSYWTIHMWWHLWVRANVPLSRCLSWQRSFECSVVFPHSSNNFLNSSFLHWQDPLTLIPFKPFTTSKKSFVPFFHTSTFQYIRFESFIHLQEIEVEVLLYNSVLYNKGSKSNSKRGWCVQKIQG